eukprot:TRINITY_DN8812_c0_g1_i1.p1 TRINITY_DN8812_c0_g1~~TRINITY_DN8812_c0_g1_i1.p1  ORF type:complete len:228 (-),score=17.51 TRINITY_DN8812_c0_g1_i1:148-765(-)
MEVPVQHYEDQQDVLTQEDLDFFEENGYVILHDAVPKQNLSDAVDAIWQHLGIDRRNPKDWYRSPATQIGFVELYHHPSFWANRTHPRIHKAFAQLWKTEKLWVSIDRACLKFPANPNHSSWDHKGFLHWDYNPWDKYQPFGLQGVLALEDTEENQGGFHCVPGLHKRLKRSLRPSHRPTLASTATQAKDFQSTFRTQSRRSTPS